MSEWQQHTAGFSERERMAAAREKLDAQRLFQGFDVMAYRRLCEMYLPARLRNTEAFGRVNEYSQAHQVNHRNNLR